MPRTARASVGGLCYHVTGRANERATVFHDAGDYREFLHLLERAVERVPVRLLAYCLMPNHYHVVVRPEGDGDLGRWAHWLLTSHVQRHRSRHGGSGRIWQGRFHASIVQQDEHLIRVLRYVERNPLRAGLVRRAEEWPWSSLRERLGAPGAALVSSCPVKLPDDWLRMVQQPITAAELEAIRTCSRRQRPYGDAAFTRGTAERLGLESTLRPRGRRPVAI
jgi:putative transposase